MAPTASIHIVDVGLWASLGLLLKRVRPQSITGLRHAEAGQAGELSGSLRPKPTLGRVAFIGFWDDHDALDCFARDHPLGQQLGSGWHARLDPLRQSGSWPGLDDEVSGRRHTSYDGPALVLTLGRLRLTQAVRFLRTSANAEAAATAAPGAIWASAIVRPPFVATCSLWESTHALASYAYGKRDPGHPDALDADAAKPFHHRSAFVRFRPYHVEGHLLGANPLNENAWVAQDSAPSQP